MAAHDPSHSDGQMGVACGNCGGNVLMATCDHFRGSGHEWVLVSICMVCRLVHWIESGCEDCKAGERD